jgi:hypothetical protein
MLMRSIRIQYILSFLNVSSVISNFLYRLEIICIYLPNAWIKPPNNLYLELKEMCMLMVSDYSIKIQLRAGYSDDRKKIIDKKLISKKEKLDK